MLDYDPSTGVLTWREDRGNGRSRAGSRAGGVSKIHGHRQVGIDGENYQEHRVVWAIVHGAWPTLQLDHINGKQTDNRIANLREVSNALNCQNKRRAPRSSSHGVLGASRVGNRWRAQIKVNGRKIYLGLFATPEQANSAYLKAKRALHPGCAF